ncbi:hypothetical protein WICPIJ_003906 [Wickerhamomyces pijperi]|uniref:Uncharacterized protein n=1 Tax=Wickerhamomyces pijperi TaxID=599730 RepID=A0A9P8Q942_WICPI|nr:hypothetical protein WICPIJ_003906 [Wickerhamomyces pijperi]
MIWKALFLTSARVSPANLMAVVMILSTSGLFGATVVSLRHLTKNWEEASLTCGVLCFKATNVSSRISDKEELWKVASKAPFKESNTDCFFSFNLSNNGLRTIVLALKEGTMSSMTGSGVSKSTNHNKQSMVFCLVLALAEERPFSQSAGITADLNLTAAFVPANSNKALRAAIPASCATTLESVTIFLKMSG